MSEYVPPPAQAAAAPAARLSRRQVVRLGLGSFGVLSLGGGVAATRAFVTEGPRPLRVEIPDFGPNNLPVLFPHSQYAKQFYLAPFPLSALTAAESLYPEGMLPGLRVGVVALRRWCPRRDSRVFFCASSACFECPNCGSEFSRVGEFYAGPAKTGMVGFPIKLRSDGALDIDLDRPYDGLERSRHAVSFKPDGPHCIGGIGHRQS